jgi:uracil-DNA glycosylase
MCVLGDPVARRLLPFAVMQTQLPLETARIEPVGKRRPATSYFPERSSLSAFRDASQSCRACGLWRSSTQTVFGEGPAKARVVLVGEQPGDQEDRAGRNFIGPAGRVLDHALHELGIDRATVYLTNAVKHFSHEVRGSVRGEHGKWRIHKTPKAAEIAACKPWVQAELQIIRPEVVVCLGAVAARSLLGPTVRVVRDRGRRLESPWAPATFVTYHPSALLRAPDAEARASMRRQFLGDLKAAFDAVGRLSAASSQAF